MFIALGVQLVYNAMNVIQLVARIPLRQLRLDVFLLNS